MNIKLRVSNLVKKHGTCNPYTLSNDLNIGVLTTRLPQSIRGFLVKPLRCKFILLNESLTEEASKIVICHELGHARLHPGYGYYWHPNRTYFVPSKREREANEFAAYLLSHSSDIDSDLIAAIINEKRPDPKTVHRILTEIINKQGGC
ncbi:ImmA/IrrE family metallo-endopeptidase [Anaerospora hongkongensis]|uniref:ImmA/IrrE family metallo-endopeptidase n=1 Tax=Anaerospora hongkongensis TaxID=244830 RepID=UPI00289BB878|nr:ImmA/IrrE family metallo-endopeptidase [Anaerospora hongkongensis]